MEHIQIASLGKRILSSLIDGLISASLMCLFYFCVFSKIVANVQRYSELNETIKNEHEASGLYVDDVIYTLKYPNATKEEIEPKLKNFYTVYLNNKDEKELDDYWYYVHILNLKDNLNKYQDEEIEVTSLYEWTDNTYTSYKVKDGINENVINEAFRIYVVNAVSTLDQYEPYRKINDIFKWGTIRAIIYSSLLATLIINLIIPLCLKNGKSVGKLITKLVIITNEGYVYPKKKLIIRYLTFYLLEVAGSIFTIGLLLIFTTSLVIFTKKRRAIHDYLSNSVVIDEVNSVFYKNEAEKAKNLDITNFKC